MRHAEPEEIWRQSAATLRRALADALRERADPAELQEAAARVLGAHLNADRALFCSIHAGACAVGGHFSRRLGPVPPGTYAVSGWERALVDGLRAGRTVAFSGLASGGPGGPPDLGGDVAAFAVAPVLHDGELVAIFALHHGKPRVWRTAELALLEETAERTWAAVARARADAALHTSEARLQVAMDAAQMGTFVWDPVADRCALDPRGRVLFGLPPATGATSSREIDALVLPEDRALRAAAIATARDPAGDGQLRGEFRIRRPTDGAVRWMTTLGQTRFAGDPPVAVAVTGVCADVTDRKEAEAALAAAAARDAFLVRLADALRPLADPVAVVARATATLGEHLGVDRAYYVEVDEDLGVARVVNDYVRDTVPSLAGEHRVEDFGWSVAILRRGDCHVVPDTQDSPLVPPLDRPAAAALGIIGCMGAPLLKDGRLVGALCVTTAAPRAWADAEVALLREVGDRIWAAVERASAEAALRESEATHRTLFDAVDDGVCLFERVPPRPDGRRDYRYVAMNPAMQAMFGIPDLSGVRIRDAFPDEVEAWYDDYDRVLDTGVPLRLERESAPQGMVIEMFVTRVEDGSGQRLLAVMRDVTARRKAEARERAIEARRRIAVEAAGVGDWTIDLADEAVVWSERALGMMWRTPADPPTLAEHFALIHPDDREAVREALGRAADPAGDGRFRAVFRFLARGEVRHIESRGQAVSDQDEEGRPRRLLLGAMLDVTEQRRITEALRAADRRKDEFLATLAHELRNPLAPLRTGLQLMRHATPPAVFEETRGRMERQVTYLVRLIDDLMDVSRITQDKLQLRKARVTLGAVVQGALEATGPFVDAAGHTLQVRLPAELVVLEADGTRLSQVLSNLLHNAAKYTEPGGTVTLSAERVGDELQLTVADTGIGIPPEMSSRIFEPFMQLDRSLERAQGGLGIGLMLVRRLVELHGGTVSARSGGGRAGSEFVVRLPVAEVHAPSPSEAPREVGAPRRRSVLVVDDNEDAAELLSALLRLEGHDVSVAHDGASAVVRAEALRPEIVLLDIGLPGMNGYEVAQRLRGEPWGREIAIVALTGWGQDEDRRRSRRAGIDAHLVKPVDLDELLALLSHLLDAAGPGRDRALGPGPSAPVEQGPRSG